jgi:acylaminoacyl-peptidase
MSKEKNSYNSSLWLLDNASGEYTPLTNGPSDKTPEWSPRGDQIAFTSRRTYGEGEKGAELWVFDLGRASEPKMILRLSGGIENIRWSPNGKKILFISNVGKHEDDVMAIERIPIWFNGKGYTYNIKSELFIIDPLTSNYRQITTEEHDVFFAEWCGKDGHIVFLSKDEMLRPYISDIYLIDLRNPEPIKLTEGSYTIWELACSPDGDWIAFRGHMLERGLATIPKIFMLNIEDRSVSKNYNLTYPAENSINCDLRGPSSLSKIQWVGDNIYFPLAVRGYVHLYKSSLSGETEAVVEGEFVVDEFSIGVRHIAMTIMDAVSPKELYLYGENLVRVTHFNDEFIEEMSLSRSEHFVFKSSDGKEIDGWIMKPKEFKSGEKYPAILEIHGGPATAYGEGFMHEFHCLAARGYVVFYFNPRGSSGYEQDFRDIRGHYGEREFDDLMEGVDYVLKMFDFVDPERLGVTGGSYGGFMTNWIITHTN